MAIRTLIVDDNNPLFDTKGMYYKEFPSDQKQIRFFTVLITKNASEKIREKNLLEQQVSEIIKNAILHGNHCDANKKVKVWYYFEEDSARLIVEDEGDGFQDLEAWNDFYQKRQKAFAEGDFEAMMKYVAWQTEKSSPDDGGNSLFAAVEYWNGGMIYNSSKNKVVVYRKID